MEILCHYQTNLWNVFVSFVFVSNHSVSILRPCRFKTIFFLGGGDSQEIIFRKLHNLDEPFVHAHTLFAVFLLSTLNLPTFLELF